MHVITYTCKLTSFHTPHEIRIKKTPSSHTHTIQTLTHKSFHLQAPRQTHKLSKQFHLGYWLPSYTYDACKASFTLYLTDTLAKQIRNFKLTSLIPFELTREKYEATIASFFQNDKRKIWSCYASFFQTNKRKIWNYSSHPWQLTLNTETGASTMKLILAFWGMQEHPHYSGP